MAEIEERKRCFLPVQCVYTPVVFIAALAVSPLQVSFDQYVFQTYALSKGLENSTVPNRISKCEKNVTSLEDEVEGLASFFTMYSKMACDIPAFITMPIWAAYGDMYGRRNPVIIASVGIIISLLVLIAVDVFHLPIWVTLVYSGIQGLSGYLGLAVCIACAAHISHYSTPQRRTMEMAILELTFYIGGTVGDLGGGFLLHYTSFRWCFVTIAGLVVVLLIYCVTVLKSGPDDITPQDELREPPAESSSTDTETLSSSNHITEPLISVQTTSEKSMKSIILQPFYLYFQRSSIRLQLWILLFIVYLHDSAHGGSYSLIDIFAVSAPLCWSPELLGYYRGGDMFAVGLGAVVVSALFESRIRPEGLLLMGQVSGAIRGVLLGLVRSNGMMYASLVAGTLRVLCIATCRSMASMLVPQQQHGAAIGGLASIQILCDVLSGSVLSFIYAKTVTFYAGVAFFVTAGFYIIGMPLSGWFAYLSNKRKRSNGTEVMAASVNS